MDPEKIGKLIKNLRKKNNLTQKDLADKYSVTYQAVSKWENGNNIPDISLLRQMSKDFNISIEEFLDGKENIKEKKSNSKIYIAIVLFLVLFIAGYFMFIKKDKSFDFKTLSTSCNKFKLTGSIAYDKNKSSIYISHIDYCGGDDNTTYDEIVCSLYENNNDTNTKIKSCNNGKNTNLEEYLKSIEINIDNYYKTCKKYDNNSLYLEIDAKEDGNITTYKIPLKLNENCSK